MGVIETLLVFTVTALNLAVMPWRIRPDELMPDTQLGRGGFKQRLKVALRVGKAVCKLEAIIRLHTLYLHAFACKGGDNLAQEISRGIRALLGIRAQNAVARVFVDGRVLI